MSAFDNLGDTISNLTMYDIKSAVRKVQNVVMNYTEIEAKVREATNNEPWGASSTQLQEIADATHNYQHFNEIMSMIYKRFSEKTAEEWRQIYKSLQLLEYLLKNGAERVIDDARQHISVLKLLRNFHYIDEKMKDQGINVRNRAKELVELLQSSERIREERKKAKADQKKFGGVSAVSSDAQFGSGGGGGGFGNTGKKYGGFSSDDYGSGAAGQVYGDGGGFTARAPTTQRVYGDGGGTSGTSSPAPQREAARAAERRERAQRNRAAAGFAEGALGSVQAPLERFDDYDEGEWNSSSAGPSRTTSTSQRTTVPKPIPSKTAQAPKPKPKEVDLFSFDDEPAPAPAATRQPPALQTNFASASSSKAPAPTAGADDDDDFDDFQSASTAMAAPAPVKQASLMNVMGPASPAKAQSSGSFDLFSSQPAQSGGSSLAPPPSFGMAAQRPQQQLQAAQPPVVQRSAAPAGPNYYASGLFTTQVNAQNKLEATAPPIASYNSAASKPLGGGGASPALGGGAAGGVKKTSGADAFGDLLSGFKTGGAVGGGQAKPKESLASLNQKSASQGIWGPAKPAAAAPQTTTSAASVDDDDFGDFNTSSGAGKSNGGGGSADLLF